MALKSLTEQPALLSVHAGAAGQYILRVADLRHRALVVAVSKLLPDATSLVIITPSDIKLFNVTNGATSSVEEPEAAAAEAEGEGPPMSDELLAAIQREEGIQQPGAVRATVDELPLPAGAEVVGETQQGTKVVRRKKSSTPAAGHDETCQRCSGAGQVKVLLDGGAAAEATCPICKGEGVMRRYGSRR